MTKLSFKEQFKADMAECKRLVAVNNAMLGEQLELLPRTQEQAILAYLQTGAALTPLEALDRFGCFRLAARCWGLRKAGWKIACDLVPVGKGKHVAQYRLQP